MLLSKQLTKRTKMKMYKTLIRPVVTYASEAICMSADEEEQFKIFERRVMRSLLGPKREADGEQKALMNHEIKRLIYGEDIVRHIKAQGIRWLGHVMKSEDGMAIREMTLWWPGEGRPRGKPRIRWLYQVTQDLRRMEIFGWKERVHDRQGWRDIVGKAENHPRL